MSDDFHLELLYKIDLQIFSQKNDVIFHIFYQIKDSRVPLWIERYYLCIEGHWKLRLQFL